jgi:hypothetical protein
MVSDRRVLSKKGGIYSIFNARAVSVWRRHEVLGDKWRKELRDFPRGLHPGDSEIEYGEPAVRSLFHNSGISNYLFPKPGDRAEGRSLFVT